MATLEGEKEYLRVIESELPLHRLKPFFMDWESVLEYHVDEMSLKYSVHVKESLCQGCGKAPATERKRFLWQAIYHTKETIQKSFLVSSVTMAFGFLRQYYGIIRFSTIHCLCSKCTRDASYKIFFGKVVGNLSAWTFWLALMALISALLVAGGYLVTGARARDTLLALGCAVAFAAVMAIAARGIRVRRKWGIPPALRKIAKEPFRIQSVEDL